MSFEDLGLSTELLRAVQEKNYTVPTAIQADAIPAVIEGRDLLAGSQTGTGKTASFTLPLLQRLMTTPPASSKKFRPIRALIVCPTRELASQVSDSVQAYGKYLPLRSNVVFGGVKISAQIFKLRRGTDVLVATPGRLLDLVNQREVDLSHVEILVLDEADRMLDMGFMPDIQRIIALMPNKTQNLLFSATYSTHIKKLANNLLDNPKVIDIGSGNSVASQVNHVIHPINPEQKRQALAFLIGSNNWKQVLVFTKTKRGAEKLATQLDKDGLSSTAIHGDKSQAQRGQALNKFKQGRVRVLVATDVAARGLDIDNLSHVVNYDLPMVAEDYIHRIGRTGRAGKSGEAISLVSPDEKQFLRDIEQLLKCSLKKSVIEGYEPNFSLSVFNKPSPSNPKQSRRSKPSNGRNSNPGASRDSRKSRGDYWETEKDGRNPFGEKRRATESRDARQNDSKKSYKGNKADNRDFTQKSDDSRKPVDRNRKPAHSTKEGANSAKKTYRGESRNATTSDWANKPKQKPYKKRYNAA